MNALRAAPIVLALAALALASLVSGTALAWRRTSGIRLSAGALLTTGAVVMTGVALNAAEQAVPARAVLTFAGAVLAPIALLSYPRPRWRDPVGLVVLLFVIGSGVIAAATPWVVGDAARVGNVPVVMFFVGATGLIVHTWWRFEHAEPDELRPLTWMAFGACVPTLLGGTIVFIAAGEVGGAIGIGAYAVLPLCLLLGVAPRDVLDVRVLVVVATVVALTVICYVAAFFTVVESLDVLGARTLPTGTLAVIAAVLAFAVRPTMTVLRGVTDEVLFGHRPDPLGAVAEVAGRLGEGGEAEPAAAVRAVRRALNVPYVAVSLDGSIVASDGVPVTDTRHRPIVLAGVERGDLEVGLRPGDASFSGDEEHVLTLVAILIAQTLQLSEVTAQVQVSREATVAALAEERRRLRHDLHDGLGPRLTGIAFSADAARLTVATDPDAAGELLTRLRAETTVAIDEIRRLVYAMRPPALDELGLVAALRQFARSVRRADGAALFVEVIAADLPAALPAATEVAAYRIVVEALTNVARHSGSPSAHVLITGRDDGLVVEVSDRGHQAGQWREGVGIESMRERAAELGGSLVAGPDGPDTGGRVTAVLPAMLVTP